MGPSGRITHVIGYIGLYCTVWDRICRFCIWVELPVQRRLCLIFVKNVGSPDIHKCFRGLTGSQRNPGFRASQIYCVISLFLETILVLNYIICFIN